MGIWHSLNFRQIEHCNTIIIVMSNQNPFYNLRGQYRFSVFRFTTSKSNVPRTDSGYDYGRHKIMNLQKKLINQNIFFFVNTNTFCKRSSD